MVQIDTDLDPYFPLSRSEFQSAGAGTTDMTGTEAWPERGHGSLQHTRRWSVFGLWLRAATASRQ